MDMVMASHLAAQDRVEPEAGATALVVRERFATGHPRGLTLVLPIAAGDMYGIKGIDHLAERGLLDRVIAGSYPSGPSSFEPPKIDILRLLKYRAAARACSHTPRHAAAKAGRPWASACRVPRPSSASPIYQYGSCNHPL